MFSVPGRASDSGPDTMGNLRQWMDEHADDYHDPHPDRDEDEA